jgi:hypothetical protein
MPDPDHSDRPEEQQPAEAAFFNINYWGCRLLLILLTVALIGSVVALVTGTSIVAIGVIVIALLLLAILLGTPLIEERWRR